MVVSPGMSAVWTTNDSSDHTIVPNNPNDNCGVGSNWINTAYCQTNVPQVTLVVDGYVNIQFDTATVLNTGGYDTACCALNPVTLKVDGNECLNWRTIGTTGLADRSGSSSTPAPTNSPPTRPPGQGCSTPAPTVPTPPTFRPSLLPTPLPSSSPTVEPTARPTTVVPSVSPSQSPITVTPTTNPSSQPSANPSGQPTLFPTSSQPTGMPSTSVPTAVGVTSQPTSVVTKAPTLAGATAAPRTTVPTTAFPTIEHTPSPTFAPATSAPTSTPAPTFPLITTLTATAGQSFFFTINSRDMFGNPSGDASTCVSIPAQCAFAFRLNDGSPKPYAPAPVYSVQYKGNSRYLIGVTSFVAGLWNVSVDTISNFKDVFGSPYPLLVSPAALNGTLSTLRNLNFAWVGNSPSTPIVNVAGVNINAQLDTRDLYGNSWLDGFGFIQVLLNAVKA